MSSFNKQRLESFSKQERASEYEEGSPKFRRTRNNDSEIQMLQKQDAQTLSKTHRGSPELGQRAATSVKNTCHYVRP